MEFLVLHYTMVVLFSIILSIAALLLVALPWFCVYTVFYEKQYSDLDWLFVPICIVGCIAEVAVVIDWIIHLLK